MVCQGWRTGLDLEAWHHWAQRVCPNWVLSLGRSYFKAPWDWLLESCRKQLPTAVHGTCSLDFERIVCKKSVVHFCIFFWASWAITSHREPDPWSKNKLFWTRHQVLSWSLRTLWATGELLSRHLDVGWKSSQLRVVVVVFFKVLEGSHQVPRNTSRCARRRNVALHYWEPKQEKHIPSTCQLGRYITGFKRLRPT